MYSGAVSAAMSRSARRQMKCLRVATQEPNMMANNAEVMPSATTVSSLWVSEIRVLANLVENIVLVPVEKFTLRVIVVVAMVMQSARHTLPRRWTLCLLLRVIARAQKCMQVLEKLKDRSASEKIKEPESRKMLQLVRFMQDSSTGAQMRPMRPPVRTPVQLRRVFVPCRSVMGGS